MSIKRQFIIRNLNRVRNGSRPGTKANAKRAAGLSRRLALPAKPAKRGAISAYQQSLCEAEMELTSLQTELDILRFKVTELEASRDYYVRLFENAPVGYIIHDGTGNLRDCNREVFDMLGDQPGKCVQGFLTGLMTRESLSTCLDHLRRCRTQAGERISEMGMTTSSG